MGEKKTIGVMKMECSPLWAFLFFETHTLFLHSIKVFANTL
jgi:hypothetical protein